MDDEMALCRRIAASFVRLCGESIVSKEHIVRHNDCLKLMRSHMTKAEENSTRADREECEAAFVRWVNSVTR